MSVSYGTLHLRSILVTSKKVKMKQNRRSDVIPSRVTTSPIKILVTSKKVKMKQNRRSCDARGNFEYTTFLMSVFVFSIRFLSSRMQRVLLQIERLGYRSQHLIHWTRGAALVFDLVQDHRIHLGL
jgi:hypothetical protein